MDYVKWFYAALAIIIGLCITGMVCIVAFIKYMQGDNQNADTMLHTED